MKDKITIGEKYGPAMEITDQVTADKYFNECVEHTMRFGHTRENAENIERSNLGYYAGYYSHETRLQVERLFRCSHPMLGKAGPKPPTPDECFAAGQAAYKAAHR